MGEGAVVRTFVVGNLLLGLAVLGGVFGALPVRYWVVDVAGAALVALSVVSAWGLWRGPRWRYRALRWSALCKLVLGLATLAALALGVAYLGGVHGSAGKAGLNALILGSLLIAPYLIAHPILQLLWLRGRTG